MNFKAKKLIPFIAGIAALATIVGSWAYYAQNSSIDNELKTDGYGHRTVEEFTPKQTVQPGSEITKTVGVENTGDYDLVVRIKMEETWERDGAAFVTMDSANNKFLTVVKAEKEAGNPAAGYRYTATQTDDTDGLVEGDDSVVHKNLDDQDWVFNQADGYWYYKTTLSAGNSTKALLDQISFADNMDMGKYTAGEYYSLADKTVIDGLKSAYDTAKADYEADPANAAKKTAMEAAAEALETGYAWTTTKPADETTITFIKNENSLGAEGGYGKANYTLRIITEVCQATKDAVDATWGDGSGSYVAPAGTAWGF